MNMNCIICGLIVIVLCIFSTDACKGCVNLDEHNFEKIIPRFEAVLVKFDVAYPYGDKHDVFNNLATDIVDNRNFILGQVAVKDYGEKDNEELAEKYGVNTKDDLPALRLFVQGEDEPFSFPKNIPWTDENLKKFVRDHTNIYVGLPGCLEVFDKLAIKFSSSQEKNKILKEAEVELGKLNNEREINVAKTYVIFMKKVIENGNAFVAQEVKRLGKIISEGKVNEKKRTELSHRLNILKSFSLDSSKSEL
ncbi:endoplasmic reticulum protein 29-like protein wbl [Leptinotarsa decemlineata]|uniref:endoplasmic reticulum protein 29-like protein wbl n=1 Tax=Leptinotarsa decemlineata TaxID=7539 RepID=UPI003D30CD1A